MMMPATRLRILTKKERESLATPAIIMTKHMHMHVAIKVSVSWSWYDEQNGIVMWSFTNVDSKQHSVILLRNGYYFGAAFWPLYVANSNGRGASATNPADNFGVDWLDGNGSKSLEPLVDKGATGNAPPLGLVGFGVSDPSKISNSNSTVAFIFTLAPKESWSMLEAGFSAQMTPSGISLYEVTPVYHGSLCIGYDQQRVVEWDLQTGTALQGYTPNPSTFNTWLLFAESDAPFDVLPFYDNYAYGQCQEPVNCTSYFQKAIQAIESGNYSAALTDIADGIDCITAGGYLSVEQKLWQDLKGGIEKLKERL